MMNDYDGGLQAHLVVNSNQDLVYVHCKVQFSYHEYSLCHRIQFMNLQSTVYVSRVQFKSQEYSLCP